MQENKALMHANYAEDSGKKIVIEHCNIIDDGFWEAHPWILGDELLSKRSNVGSNADI